MEAGLSIAEQDIVPIVDEVAPEPEPAREGVSILSHLRQRYDEIAQEETPELLLEVPGWKGALAVRYRYPEAGTEPIVKALERAQNTKDRDALISGNCDVLIAACTEIVGRIPGGEWESLDANVPVRFSPRLADLLGIEVAPEVRHKPRFIVREVFSPRAHLTGIYDGDMALMTAGGSVITWLQNSSQHVGEVFEGE